MPYLSFVEGWHAGLTMRVHVGGAGSFCEGAPEEARFFFRFRVCMNEGAVCVRGLVRNYSGVGLWPR